MLNCRGAGVYVLQRIGRRAHILDRAVEKWKAPEAVFLLLKSMNCRAGQAKQQIQHFAVRGTEAKIAAGGGGDAGQCQGGARSGLERLLVGREPRQVRAGAHC